MYTNKRLSNGQENTQDEEKEEEEKDKSAKRLPNEVGPVLNACRIKMNITTVGSRPNGSGKFRVA